MAAAPWHPQLLPYLARPHRPTWRVSAHHPDLPGGSMVLQVARLQVSWDESRAPRVQLRVDVVAPTDPAVDALLDPRTAGLRLHVHAGHIIGGVDDRVLIADLGLRVRGITQPDGTTLLDAQSDEALVMDAAPSSVSSGLASNSSRGHIQVIIGQAITSPTFVVTAPTDPGGSFAVAAGDLGDKWAKIEDLADALGDVDVYDDGLRVWYVEARPTLAATADLELVHGEGGTVVQTASTTDRDSWANRVILVYRWTVSGTESVIQSVRSVTTGPHAATTGNVKAWTTERKGAITQARADVAAASLVKRKASQGRVHTIRAVAVPWLRPGHTVKVTTRLGSARYLVSSVVFDGAGWMELTTRYPDSTMTIGA